MSKKKSTSGNVKTSENLAPAKVKMKFSEAKYYNDLDKPMFEANKVYEIEGADWIQRWVKRGGEIVDGELPFAEPEQGEPSKIVGKGGDQTGDKTPDEGDTTPDSDNGDDKKSDDESTETKDSETKPE